MQTAIKMNLSGRLSTDDGFGRMKAILRDAGGNSSFNHSNLRDAGGNSSFNHSNNRVTANRGGKISWKESDSLGLETKANEMGEDIVYKYFPDGNFKTIIVPAGGDTGMQHADTARNQIQLDDQSAGIIKYTYYSFG